MIPTHTLTNKVTKLEHRHQANVEFQVVEEDYPETEFGGHCDFVLRRNGVPVVRWPKKLSVEQWLETYRPQTNPN